ncbi:small and basic intrinsic protein 2 [Perilla frutescens var. frutescens]|nr:small and basic intrinsic protein 2 [Perilla frutescens var. frutescens]
MAGEGRRLVVADFMISLMWVSSNELIKILVQGALGNGANQLEGDIAKWVLSLLNMFVIAYISTLANGATYNPLTVLATAISGDFSNFLFTVGARIPAQVVGSVYGARLILLTFPGIERGPHLNVDIAKGALTEGLLAFAIVIITLGLAREITDDFFMKTWISSLSKLTLHILGSDLTGGCMNPASVMGWAFANKHHITKEHLIVYWLAPVEATLVAVWLFGILFGTKKDEQSDVKKVTSPQQKSKNSDQPKFKKSDQQKSKKSD